MGISDDFYQDFIGVQDSQCEMMMLARFGSAINLALINIFQSLNANALRCALVISSSLVDVKHNFKGSQYLDQFEVIITSENVKNSKPVPDGYLMACEKLNVSPQECLVLEDSNNGALSVLNAGCQVIMVPDMLPSEKDIASKVTVVSSLEEVIGLLTLL